MCQMIATILVSSASTIYKLTKTNISFVTAAVDAMIKGKRIGTGTMPRTRRSVALANTPSNEKTTVTSSNQNKIPKIQNGIDQQRNRGGQMESLLKKRNDGMPCMTGLDRVVNWKSSTEYAVVDYYKNVRIFV